MKSREAVLKAFSGGRKSGCIDGRDMSRLSDFLTVDEWSIVGMTPADGADLSDYSPRPWTEEEIKKQLADDVSFGFEKALDKRGISSGLMYECVKMWLWVLDDPLQDMDDYAQYGLPLFKAVAVKYGLNNPIGDKTGTEREFEG